MRLRLSKRFFAALMAAIASVTFTSAGTATLGAAAFTFSMQQAAAAEQIESSASSNTDTAVTVEASGDKKASDDEESEEVEAEEELLEPDSAPAVSVGANGIVGSSDAGYSPVGAENVGNLDNAPQQQAGAQSVSPSASLPSDDLGFTTNSYADSIAEALADVESPSVPAAIAAELELATPAKPTSSESSSSSNGSDAPLASGSFAPMGTSSWFGSYASNSFAPVSQGLSSSDLPITLLGAASPRNLVWDNHESDNKWSDSENWHLDGETGSHVAFTTGDNVTFNNGTTTTTLTEDTTAGIMTVTNAANVTVAGDDSLTLDNLLVTGNGTQVDFVGHVTVAGGVRANVGYNNTANTNEKVTFENGFSYTGDDTYALVIGKNNQVVFGGNTTLTKNIGYQETAKVILAEGATLTVVDFWAAADLAKNGLVEVGNGATLTTTGLWKTTGLTNAGTVNVQGDATINALSGAGDFVVAGTGKTVTINGSGGYTGTVTVNGGTLKRGSADALGSASSIIINTGGTLDLNGMAHGAHTYTLNGGTLTNTGSAIGDQLAQTVGLTLTGNSTISADSGHEFRLLASGWNPTTATLNGNTLTKTGTGQVEFRNTAVTDGVLDIQGGSIKFYDSNGQQGSMAADVKLNGGNVTGTINLADNISVLAGQVTSTAAAINTAGHVVSFDGAEELTVSGKISGNGGLAKDGVGTLILSGDNTYSGATVVNAGTVRVGSQTAFGSSSSITVNKDATIDLHGQADARYTYTLNGGTLTNTGNTISATNAQTLGLILTGSSTISADSGHDFRLLAGGYEQTEAKLNNHTLTKTGSGQVEFRNTTVLEGLLDIQGGSILFNDSNNRHGSLKANVKLDGGTVVGTINMGGNVRVQTVQDAETTAAINTNGNVLTFDGTGNLIASGAISGNGSVIVDGTGTSAITLSGSNNYTGGTTITSGTLVASNSKALGSGSVDVDGGMLSLTSSVSTGDLSVEDGATLKFYQAGALNTGALDLKTGSILDLSNISYSGSPIVLATATGGITLGDVALVNMAAGYTGTVRQEGQQLLLTMNPTDQRDLIWHGGSNLWDAGTTPSWHTEQDTQTPVIFHQNDNVKFESGAATATLDGNITAATMAMTNDAAVALNTNGNNLVVQKLDAAGGSLTKTGTGKASFGGAATVDGVTLNTLKVDDGTVEFNQHVTVDANRINVAYAVKDAKTGVKAVFNKGLDFTGTDSKNYSMVVGYENTVVLGGESNLGSNKIVGIARNGTLELQDGAKASVGSVLNSSAPDNNGTLKLGKDASFTISNPSGSSTLTNIVNNGTLNVYGGLTVHSAVSGEGEIVYNGPAGKTMLLNGGGEMGQITVINGDFVTTGAEDITLRRLDVQGGTAHVGNSGAVDLGDVDLQGGELVLNTTVSAESLTTSFGSTLTFAGIDNKILTTSGDINLGSGTTFDLSNITYRTDVAQQKITLATSGTGAITLGGNYSFTNPKTTGATFSLEKQDNNLVLVVDQKISPFQGGDVRYTYTDGQGKQVVAYESTHGYDFSAADGGVVEFNPNLFNNETHTYRDDEARTMPLHADTTFVVEEGNTVILGAQVIGNDNEDGGRSGSFTKDGGGTLVMALNSGVFSKEEQGKKLDYNHYEGDVIVKEGTLHILPHSRMKEDEAKTSMLAGREDATVTVNKGATLILDPTTGILMPYGNENSGEVNNSFTLRTANAGGPETTLTNLLLDKSGLRPVDARDGARANVTDAWTFTIADSRTLQDAMTITAADITVIGEMGLEGNFTIDNTHIKATGDCDINERAVVYQGKNPTAVLRNGSIIEFRGEEAWTSARIWNSDVDKTSKINFFGKNEEEYIAGYLAGNNKIEVASTENDGVAERKIETGEDLITAIDYTTDQYKGMILYDAGEGYPLSFAVTLSDTDLPEDLSNSEFYLTFTDLDSSALLTDEFVDVRDIMDVSLIIPQYTGGDWEELVAAVYAKFDGVDTVFMFQHVTPEPTTSTLSLLALAALAARRRRRK